MTTPASRYTPANFAALISIYWQLRLHVNEAEPIRYVPLEEFDADYDYQPGLTVFASHEDWVRHFDGLGRQLPDEGPFVHRITMAHLVITAQDVAPLRVLILNTDSYNVNHTTLLEAGEIAACCRLCVADVYRNWSEIKLAPYMKWVEGEIERLKELREKLLHDPSVKAKTDTVFAFSEKVQALVQARRQARVEWRSFTEECAFEAGIYASQDGVYIVAEAPSNFHDAASHEEPLMLTVKWSDMWARSGDLIMAGRSIRPAVMWLGKQNVTWEDFGSMEPWFAWLDEQIAQWTTISQDPAAVTADPEQVNRNELAECLRSLADQIENGTLPPKIVKVLGGMVDFVNTTK